MKRSKPETQGPRGLRGRLSLAKSRPEKNTPWDLRSFTIHSAIAARFAALKGNSSGNCDAFHLSYRLVLLFVPSLLDLLGRCQVLTDLLVAPFHTRKQDPEPWTSGDLPGKSSPGECWSGPWPWAVVELVQTHGQSPTLWQLERGKWGSKHSKPLMSTPD